MILKNCGFSELAERMKSRKNRIVIYGAGMIGQTIVPYFLESAGLEEQVECFVDMDVRKKGEKISVGGYEFEIHHPDLLKVPIEKLVVLITNSKFYPVVEYLDKINSLDSVEGYIIPVIQLLEKEKEDSVVIRKIKPDRLIPRKIHYCWFGEKEMPKYLLCCMESWRNHCPDYEIICWNEDNYDLNRISFAKEAYENEKYALATDAVRLDILYEHGGIYMDTDVSLMKNLDILLHQPAFTGVEKWGNINTGGMMGAIPGHPMIKEMLDYRSRFHFILEDGSMNMETNGMYETVPFIRHGMKLDGSLQYINGVTVYPASVFHPYDYVSCEEKIREWTVSEHHFYGGWMNEKSFREREDTQKKYRNILKRMNSIGRYDDEW